MDICLCIEYVLYLSFYSIQFHAPHASDRSGRCDGSSEGDVQVWHLFGWILISFKGQVNL
jgi:hypothetical protein